MLSTAIGIQFDVNDLDATYEVIGSSDNYSFQYNLGKGSNLVDFEGDTAQKTISLKGNYGDFDVRVFAISDIGIRSAFIEDKISISPPSFENTFTFSDIRVSNLPDEPNIGSTIEIEPSASGNILAVNSEYVNKNLEIEWRLAPPIGHAKEGLSLGNELLSDKLLKNFSLQIRNTENGNIISSSELNNSLGLQQTLNTSSVSDSMNSYTGFSFIISEDTVNELNLDRTLALEVVCHDAFDRQSTGVLTGINYFPTVDTLSYGLFGAKMSFSWSHSDTDFKDVEIISLGIPGEENIHDPLNIQNSIDYYNSLNSAPNWEKHSNYRIGDKVENSGQVFECLQSYSYSSNPGITTDQQAYWSGLGEPFLFYSEVKTIGAVSNAEYNQIWGYNYYYSFLPSDGYGTGERLNLTETGLSAGGTLAPFKSDVKIDNLNFIEREDDLIFRWNITDQDNNLVDLNQYKFLIGNTDKPTILGLSGSLFDSDTNKFLTGITDGLNSRTSTTENGQEIIVEDLPGTKVFETFEYTREINNELYKVGGFPRHFKFSATGQYNTGDYVTVNNENLYKLISNQSIPFTQPEYTNWNPGINYVFRTGNNYSDSVLYLNSIYCATGVNHQDIVGPDDDDVLGIFNETNSYSVGDLIIAPSENIEVYKTGNIFNLGDKVLYQGSLYRASREQSPQDAIYPNTGINHWFTVGAFSDINCFVYKAISNVSAGSEILPNTGFNHWLKQTPDVSDKYKLYATGYDFVISPWSNQENFNNSSFVIYENDIWSGVADSGPDTTSGAKIPNLSNSDYWVNSLGGSHDFSTNHQSGDKVYSNGFVYKCLANNPTGAPILAINGIESEINSSYEESQWIPYWELDEDFNDVVFAHEGIPQSGKRSVGLELAILDPNGDILNFRKIIGNNPEPSISPRGFNVDSLSNATKVHFNFNYAFGSREQTTKVQLYRSSDPVFSILDSNGLPGSGASSFVSEILGPGDATFGENITLITDEPPIPNNGVNDEITGYYYKILPFDAFGSGDLFNVRDNQGDLERVLVYPHGYSNQNKNGYMGPVFSTTEDAIPGPVNDFKGDTAFRNYFLNWKLPNSQYDSSNNLVSTSPNDISHYELWQSEDNYLYFGTENTTLQQDRNVSGYRKVTGDLTSIGPIPSEINDPALGITNATNVLNISAISPSVSITHQGEPNDKRYFWVRAVDYAGNKGPFTGKGNLNLEQSSDVIGLDLVLGQAKTTDVADFEQNITQTFPNTLALVPNDPFIDNQPINGEISWDRHFLYSNGTGYVVGASDTNLLKNSQGISTAKYIYWTGSEHRLNQFDYINLGLAQPGERIITLQDGQIDSNSLSKSSFRVTQTTQALGVDGKYDGHYIKFKNGTLEDEERKILKHNAFATYAEIILDRPFNESPGAGDKVSISKDVPLTSDITNPLRNVVYSGQYLVSDYHPAGEGETNDPSNYAGSNDVDSFKPKLLDDNDFIIARNAGGIATPMWHAFANALIGTAHIEEAAITNAKIHNLTADKIRSAEIQSQDIQVGGTNSGQIRSAAFGAPNPATNGQSFDCVDYPGKGFVISGNGTFVFKTDRGKLFFEDDELTIHGNIRQKDGSELTVMSMTAEPNNFPYEERQDGVYVPEFPNSSSKIVVRYNNSAVTSTDVRFRMEGPNGEQIFQYDDVQSNGSYNISGFTYDPSTNFEPITQTATALFSCGDKESSIVGFDTIIHRGDNIPDFESVVIFASGNGTSTEHSTTVSMLSAGAVGPTGRTPVYRGVWRSSNDYLGIEDGANSAEELRGDLVYYDNSSNPAGPNGHYYIALHNNGPSYGGAIEPGVHSQSDDYWKTFGAQFESVATKLLLADNAVITHSLTMGSSDSENPAANGAGGKIVSSNFLGGFNQQLTALASPENYSTAGFRLQKSATAPYHVAFDIGGPASYFRYSSIGDKVEIKGSFINNSVSQNVQFNPTTAPSDSQAIFIGAGYNNVIGPTTHSSNLNSLASSIVGGAENTINAMFSFIGNGYGNTLKDDYSAIVAGYQNQMPNSAADRDGANIIGAGYQNEINGGSVQGIFCGAKNNIDNSTNAIGKNEYRPVSTGWTNVLKRGLSPARYSFGWIIDTWVNTDGYFNVLGHWPTGFWFERNLLELNDAMVPVSGWFFSSEFGWVFGSWIDSVPNIYSEVNVASNWYIHAAIFSTTSEWVVIPYPDPNNNISGVSFPLAFYKATSGQGLWFDPAHITNSSSLGVFEHGSGKRIFKVATNSAGAQGWYDVIVNQANEVWYSASYSSGPTTTTNSKMWYKK